MISILIPTLNRSEFLIRALHYYSKIGFSGHVCIGDSSGADHADRTQRAIQNLHATLKIVYRHFANPPYANDALVLRELIEMAPTPYAVYSGDDDFVIPNALAECARFLEDQPEYVAARGHFVAIRLGARGAFGKVESANWCRQPVLDVETASARLAGYMRFSLSTQYYVHRKETWRRMYRDVPLVPIRYLGPEVLPCSLTAVLGKVKDLDVLSTVFQMNDDRVFGWDKQSVYGLTASPEWSRAVPALRKSVVEALMESDGLDARAAEEVFDREFWWHITAMLQMQYQTRFGQAFAPQPVKRGTLEAILSNIPFITRPATVLGAFRRMRRLLTARHVKPVKQSEATSELSLETLLDASCAYHADFMPVYDIVTAPPAELRALLK